MATPLLEVRHVFQHFSLADGKPIEILRDINLEIREEEVVALLGPSGCGKSTLLRAVIGLEKPSSGEVFYRGVAQTGLNPSAALVFQNFALFPWLTVQQNIAVGLSNLPVADAEREQRVRRVIDTVGLEGFEEAYPKELSGGMKQRVGLARAFATEPKVLLLDEPFAQIDALTRGVIQEELVRMWTASSNTVFMVTHDVDEAILLSDRIALMTNGPDARLAEIVEVKIPRPRFRSSIIDDPEYARLRSHIIHFLVERSRHLQEQALADAQADTQVDGNRATGDLVPTRP
jgi:nitrate ABC transporter ATP-binding subunit